MAARPNPPTLSLESRLRRARTRLHLTQDQVQERTGIGSSTLSEFEHGRRQPNLGQLRALANLYQHSLAWFLEPEEEVEEGVVLWRERPSVEVAASIEATFRRLSQQYRNLEVWCGESDDCHLPGLSKQVGQIGYPAAARLAKTVRDELALGDRPGENLLRVLEEVCNIKVFHLGFEPTGTAASFLSPTLGASILLNKQNVPWRRTFDLAHELFHLLTWNHFRDGWSGEPLVATEREEKLANAFAGNLLLPEEPFRLAVQKRFERPNARALADSIDRVYSIAREFGVSVDAVLVRISFVFSLDWSSLGEAREAWSSSAHIYEQRHGEEGPDDLPQRYQALAVSALSHGEVSVGRFAEYMGISRYRAMQLMRSKGGDGSQAAPAPS